MSDKREAARLSMLGHLPGEIMVLEPMLVAELSRSGATIETRFPLQLNSLHDLRLTLRPRPVVIKGRVIHCRISDVDQDVVTYLSGMEFVEPTERVVTAIGEFLDGLALERRDGPS